MALKFIAFFFFAEIIAQAKSPQRTRPNESHLRFIVRQGIIFPQTRISGIRPIRDGSYIIGMDDRGFFSPIFDENGETVAVGENGHTRRIDVSNIQYRPIRSPHDISYHYGD